MSTAVKKPMLTNTEQVRLACLNCRSAATEENQDTGLCTDCLPLLSLPRLAPVDLEEDADAVRPATIQITAPKGMDKPQALARLATDPICRQRSI